MASTAQQRLDQIDTLINAERIWQTVQFSRAHTNMQRRLRVFLILDGEITIEPAEITIGTRGKGQSDSV